MAALPRDIEGVTSGSRGARYTRDVAKHRRTNLLRESKNPLPLREEVEWFRDRLLCWAEDNGRDFPWRHTDDEYQIVVTEILLQQTTAASVAKLYDAFCGRFPRWQSLHEATEDEVRIEIQCLGLATQRTRRVKELAAWVAEHDWHLPRTREELEDVPGIGQYVASALLAVKYGEPEPLLDVNMARVLERFFRVRELADIRDDPWLQAVSREACAGLALGWACLDLAAAICTARRAECGRCQLRTRCQSRSLSVN